MTREEAIKHLAYLQTIGRTLSDDTLSAFALAEDALKNENDVLDRVVEIIDKLHDTTFYRYPKGGHMEGAREELRACRKAVLALKGGEQE